MKQNIKKLFSKRNILKGTRGAISLFLAMLMVPFTTIAGALLTAARVNSASTIFDEAMSNAADSTLADWDTFLKKRFGLLSVKQDTNADVDNASQALEETFSSYLKKNTSVLSNTFFDVEGKCKGMYSLADTDILRYQMLEYSKLSVPTVLAFNGLDINGIISSLENLIPGKQWLGLISSGMDMGSSISDLGTAMDSLADAAREKEQAKTGYDNSYNSFEASVKALSDKIAEKERALAECDQNIAAQENTVTDTKSEVDRLQKAVGVNNGQIESLNDQISALKSVLDLINAVLDLKKDKVSDSSELKEVVDDVIEKGYLERPNNYNDISVKDLKDIVEKKKKECEDKLKSLTSSSVYKDYSNANQQYSDATQTLSNLKLDRANKEQNFNNEISSLRQAANGKRDEYISKIGELISKLKTEKARLTAANDAVTAARSSFSNLATSAMDSLTENDKKQLDKEQKAAKQGIINCKNEYGSGEMPYEEYSNQLDYYSYVSDLIDETKASNKNMSTLYETASTTLTEAVNAGDNIFNDFDEQYYDAIVQQLEELKTTVSTFSADSVTSTFSQSSFKGLYYKNLTLLTEKMVDDSQTAILNELIKDSLWETIKLLFEALKSLIKMLCVYDPTLNSNIDTDFYISIKAGWENLEKGNDSDKAQAQIYKDLFGSFGATDLVSDGAFNILDCIKAVFTDINTISGKVTGVNLIKSLFELGKTIQEIEQCLSDIKAQFSNLVDWAKHLVERFYEKTLIAGYLSYSTSCRTTYSTGRALTGASFNLRSQDTSFEQDFSQMNGISDFISMFSKAFTGETAKCFVGAEQEYLLNGKNSEIGNQVLSFLEIYALRLICDIFIIIGSAEVAEMSASCGPFFWVVYVLEILFDPLVDTLILTSGGSVALVKTQPFLVPSGIPSLIETVTEISLSNAQSASISQAFADSAGKINNKNDQGTNKVKSAISFKKEKVLHNKTEVVNGIEIDTSLKWEYKRELFKFDYQNYLFLYMMFCPSDKLITRFRDIVEYEAVQNLESDDHNVFVSGDSSGGGAGTSMGTPFDLARSYTYLRCEATFTTNEFISLSGSNVNMKRRLVYRGY